MSVFNQLKWAVAHDPCRADDRAPKGAVPIGASVKVKIRVEATALPLVKSADVLVLERGFWDTGASWRNEPLHSCGNGFEGSFSLRDDPHVAFYLFALTTVDDETFYYVPCIDGRSTAGELVRSGIDGELTDEGWQYAIDQWSMRPVGEFGLQEMNPGFQITVYEPSFEAPGWMSGAIMYQIFPDRFARGSKGIRADGIAYHERMGRPVRLHESWDEPMEWKAPAEEGQVPELADALDELEAQMAAYDPVDFYGGTLEGIREKLPYLASLGVEVIYLNPVFEARSNHRYDTADYERIDPLLGSEDDLRSLVEDAKDKGIAIVLDAVLSHTGDDSRYFNVNGTYDGQGAMQGEHSPFYHWYDFADPDDRTTYRCWWGYSSLPEVNEQDVTWQRYMLGRSVAEAGQPASHEDCAGDSDDSLEEIGVLGKWIRMGVRGYRIDVADEIPDDVLERIRACVKQADPEAAVIGEVWEDATVKTSYGVSRTYALGRSLDSVMNYPLRSALIGFALGTVDAHQLATFLKQQKANYPGPLYAGLMNLLSTHDVERMRSALALGDLVKHLPRNEQIRVVEGITPAQDRKAALMQRMIVALLYALPGMPCIYYGDERGMQGGGDPFCRATFPWAAGSDARNDVGEDLSEFYQHLGSLRKDSPALRTGAFACSAPDSDVVCVFRYDAERRMAVVAASNRSDIPRRVAIDLFSPALSLPPGAQTALRNALIVGAPQFCSQRGAEGVERISCEGGIVHLTVPPCSTTYWQANA